MATPLFPMTEEGSGISAVITGSPGSGRSVMRLPATWNPHRICTEPISFEGGVCSGRFSARVSGTPMKAAHEYRYLAGKARSDRQRQFKRSRTPVTKDNTIISRASQRDCQDVPLKSHCCPNVPYRKIP
jgi:hypothetical protein